MFTLHSLTTPCLLLEGTRLLANTKRATERAQGLDVTLRPHLKTAKSAQVARMALGDHWSSAAVSSLPELAMLMDLGLRDIRYTSPFSADKIPLIAPLVRKGLRLEILIDDMSALHAVNAAARDEEVKIGALVEVDVDGNRAGIRPESTARLAAQIDATSHVSFAGLYSFAGATYRMRDTAARAAAAETHRATLVHLSALLASQGVTCTKLGIGGSPAFFSARSLEGLTEVCAGVYMFQDLAQVGAGVASIADIAVSVLATVTQHKPDDGRIFVDAGGLALSQDRSTASQTVDQGYGLVCDADRCLPLGDGDIVVKQVSQEHGTIMRRNGSPAPARLLPVGARVRILPNHVCMTAAAHRAYFLVDPQGAVTEEWPRVQGWTY